MNAAAQPYFSIIIPSYNSASWLHRSLESLIEQTYEGWEAICVDDGSSDTSWSELRNWQQRDGRIRAFQQEHAGVSVARNLGIEKAAGRYAIFLDCDDQLRSDCLEALCEAQESHPSDWVTFGVQWLYDDGSTKDDHAYRDDHPTTPHYLNLSAWYLARMHPYCCNKVYSLELIRQHQLGFAPGVPLNEDLCFALNYAFYMQRCYILPEPYYIYWQRENSACREEVRFSRPIEHYTNHVSLYVPLMRKIETLPWNRRHTWRLGLYMKVSWQVYDMFNWMKDWKVENPELKQAIWDTWTDFMKMSPRWTKLEFSFEWKLPRAFCAYARLLRPLGIYLDRD